MKPSMPKPAALWILSSGFLEGGDATLDLIRSGTYRGGYAYLPVLFLYFRSIELGLKAILVGNGVSEREIAKALGHRISALIRRVEGFVSLVDLGISSSDRAILDKFSDDYSEKWFEYPARLWRPVPKLDQLRKMAHEVCDAVKARVRKF